MQVGTYGVFSGGLVTVNTVQAGIDITPAIIRTQAGLNLAFGRLGRKILVQFGASVGSFEFDAIRPTDFDAPLYTLSISNAAGSAYLAFDSENFKDIVVVSAPATGQIILAEVSWPTSATTLAQLTLDFTDRQESRVLQAENPLEAAELYNAGMSFMDVEFNKPLVSFAVMAEVLQGEATAKNAGNFAFVIIQPSDVTGLNTALTIDPFRVVLRTVTGPDTLFRVIETKTTFTFNYTVGSIPGERIYIWVDNVTGEVFSDVIYNPANTTLVGYGDVPFGATGLQDVTFVLASEVGEASAQAGTSIGIQNLTLASGFLSEMSVTPSPSVPKAVTFGSNIATVNGVEYFIPQSQVVLPDAPLTAPGRTDLVFIELYREVSPSPPTDGSYYITVPGVGYVVAKSRYVTVPGVTYADPDAVMLDSLVTGLGSSNFVRSPNGHFTAPYVAAHGGESYGMPVALIYRFHQGVWTYAAIDGAGLSGLNSTRPDGKKHNFVTMDEVETVAPIANLHGSNHSAIFGKVLDQILQGAHSNKLGLHPVVSGYLSKKPLQVDAISATAQGSATLLSAPDGARRSWSANSQPYWVGTNFAVNVDATSNILTYEDGSQLVTLIAPDGALLALGGVGGDQPVVQLKWVGTGLPGVLTGPWTVGVDQKSASAFLNTLDAGYNLSDVLAVSFSVEQEAEDFLSETPVTLHQAKLNAADYLVADTQPSATTVAGTPAVLTAVGSTSKADALLASFSATGDGTDVLTIPATLGTRNVIGVRKAFVTTGSTTLAVKSLVLGSPNHTLTLSSNVANGLTVVLDLVLDGRLCNSRPKSRELSDFAQSVLFSTSKPGGAPVIRIALPNNRVLRGSFSYLRVAPTTESSGVFVDGYLYPVTVAGFDRNLVELTLTLTPSQYAALPGLQQSKWVLDVPNNYYYLAPGTYALKLPLLWSDALQVADALVVTYAFQGLPFTQAPTGAEYEILARGWILATNSSIANTGTAYGAPVGEKLPVSRGKLKGADAVVIESTFVDPATVQMSGRPPFEGTTFQVNGAIDFDIGVASADAGVMGWVALVRLNRQMRVFAYVVESTSFSVGSPPNAFLSLCAANYVE